MYEKIAMRRREVESSNIKSIGHSYPRRLLEIEFKDGNIYRYKGVNHKTYRALMNAESKGKEFHKNIKYSYPYKKYKDKEGNKMNNKYEMLVKQAYEEIVDSFEKEANSDEDEKKKTKLRNLALGAGAATGAVLIGGHIANNKKLLKRYDNAVGHINRINVANNREYERFNQNMKRIDQKTETLKNMLNNM